MAWYDERKSATSNVTYSVRKFSYGVCSLAGHDPVEGFITGSHFGEVELHLAYRLCENDV
jgi:hypothetical protein